MKCKHGLVKKLHLRTSNVLKQIAIDTHYLKHYVIMNRNEQEMYDNLRRLTIAMEKLVKLLTKTIKDNA